MRVIMGWAELKALLPGISPPPPPPGMPDPFVSAPPLIIWILFLLAALYSFKKSFWSTILALLFLGIATQSPLLAWWSNGPLGSFVQNLRRFAAPMSIMMLITIAYAWERHSQHPLFKRYIYTKPIIITLLLVSSSFELLTRYPLLWTPSIPLIAQTINRDPTPGAVLVYPQEQEHKKAQTHQYLRKNTSFSNPQARLWFQTLIDRPMHHHSKLATLISKGTRRWKFDGGGLSMIEVEELRQKGLRYIILDHKSISKQQLQQYLQLFQRKGYGCSTFKEWGSLSLCLLENR